MGIIKPTLGLTSEPNTVTNGGPLSWQLNLTVTDDLTVDLVDHFTIPNVPAGTPAWGKPTADLAAGTPTFATLVDGSVDANGVDSTDAVAGTVGCWIYIKNTTASGSELIYIGRTTDADATGAGQTYTELSTDNADQRLFTLKAGEFAWFPFDYTGDLYCDASAASQSLEFWRFDR